MSKKHGEITRTLGNELSNDIELKEMGFSVFYNHGTGGEENVGVASVWIGQEKKMNNRLSEIDIVIYKKCENRAILLIEIEESGDNPKKIIGAAMATLFGEKISPSGQPELKIDIRPTLLVLAKGHGESHLNRTEEIENHINEITGISNINRMGIGKVRLILFQPKDDLKKIIMDELKSHP